MSGGLQFARRIRTSPYFGRVQSHGVAGYSVYNHMILPKSSGMSVEEAYWHLNEHVQIWDVSVQRQVEIMGPDAARLVQWITPRDLRAAVTGRCCHNPYGRRLGRHAERPCFAEIGGGQILALGRRQRSSALYKGASLGGGFDVQVEEPDVNPLAIQGPKAMAVMAELFGEEITKLGFFHYGHVNLFGTRRIVSRSGLSAKAGFEIYLDDSSLAEPLWDLVCDAGKPHGMQPGGPNLIDRTGLKPGYSATALR